MSCGSGRAAYANQVKGLLHILTAVIIIVVTLPGCKDDGTSVVSHPTNPDVVPTVLNRCEHDHQRLGAYPIPHRRTIVEHV